MNRVLNNLPPHIDHNDFLNALKISSGGGHRDHDVEVLAAVALGRFIPLAPSAERTLLDLLLNSGASRYAAESLANANLSAQQPYDYQRIEKWLVDAINCPVEIS